jgi:hypothetical protein
LKHAGQLALDQLEDILERVREHPNLKERKRGAFYLKSRGFLHFHEDLAGLFADLKVGDQFERFRVTTAAERKKFLSLVASLLRDSTTAKSR